MKKRFILELDEEELSIMNPDWIVREVTYEPMMSDEYSTPFIDAVMEQVKDDVMSGYVEALDEVLRFTPRTNLVQYGIPEEEWGKWMTDDELDDIDNGRTKQ